MAAVWRRNVPQGHEPPGSPADPRAGMKGTRTDFYSPGQELQRWSDGHKGLPGGHGWWQQGQFGGLQSLLQSSGAEKSLSELCTGKTGICQF